MVESPMSPNGGDAVWDEGKTRASKNPKEFMGKGDGGLEGAATRMRPGRRTRRATRPVVGRVGIEPTTVGLKGHCSTD